MQLRTSEMFDRFVEGEPSCLVSEGRLELDALDRERISQEEPFELLRGAGVSQLAEVKPAFPEQSGTLSVYAFAPRHVQAGLPFVPPWDIEDPAVFEAGAEGAPFGDYACTTCGERMTRGAATPLTSCPRCKRTRW